CMQGTLLWTF
nr:immunoglobulin light chain junction region [Macaca mulatta]